jgi:hypothetical protein
MTDYRPDHILDAEDAAVGFPTPPADSNPFSTACDWLTPGPHAALIHSPQRARMAAYVAQAVDAEQRASKALSQFETAVMAREWAEKSASRAKEQATAARAQQQAAEDAVEVAERERRSTEVTLQQARGAVKRQGDIMERAGDYLDRAGVPADMPLDDRVRWLLQNSQIRRWRPKHDEAAAEARNA